MMAGNLAAMRPALMCWMVKPDPQAITRATASPGPATGSGTSVNSNRVFGPFRTIAFIAVALCQRLRSVAEHEIGRLQEQRPVHAVRMQKSRRVAHQLFDP